MHSLGERMKEYEVQEAGRRFLPMLPICARIDGKGFSKFTKGLKRPFDIRLVELMCETAEFLLEQSNACLAYTQSDEISLLWYSPDYDSQTFFDRRIQKMVSVLAAMATAYFNQHLAEYLPEKAGQMPLFDARVWQVPTQTEAVNTILWREIDASKNSVSMAAREYYSHKALHKKNAKEMQEMLLQKGINWNDYPDCFKRGTYIQKRKVLRAFSTNELSALPPKHDAHQNPVLMLERSEIKRLQMAPFTKVKNRVEVIFEQAEPVIVD